ncbi:unnamed protein product [Linum trigynum]|uniref:Uncharacterized protein n=1 Tax=Linum trigynum TaxID=586398 RepID=A0AAV2E8R9_9ROSI
MTEFDHCAMIAVTPVHAISDQVHEPVVYPSAPPAPRPPWPSGYSLACILPDGQVELTDDGGRIRRVHGHNLKLYLKSDVDPLLEAPVPSPP